MGARLARVVFVDSSVPVDGGTFFAGWPDGGAELQAVIAENGGWWPLVPADYFDGQGLSAQQVARILAHSTPHPGATLVEPAVLTGPLGELPATYVLCLLAGDEPGDTVAELLTSDRWRLVEMPTGHWPMFSQPRELAQILLDAASESTTPTV
ncbi:alpha/beta fold hydrolase [Hamadaea sp. NPDC050747]|uniref:alpha/beta fold hydrolase n=1 Tax=Hamadaea sp. NPDC050747 TaxID=3155789 RepID=UPI0033D53799